MGVISRFFALFGQGAKYGIPPPPISSSEKKTRTSGDEQDVVPTNAAEHELLERVRTLGLRGRCDIQYASGLCEPGKYLAVLPWPGDEDVVKHGTFNSLTPPKEGGAVSMVVSGITTATKEVAEKYGYEPLFTSPFPYAGGVYVMLFGLKQKVV